MNYTIPTADPHEARHTFSMVGFAYAFLILGTECAIVAGRYLLAYLAPHQQSAWWVSWVLSLIPLYTVGLGLLWLILRQVPTSPHNADYAINATASAEKPRFHVGHWLILLVIAFGCMTAGGLASNVIMAILSAALSYDYANALNTLVSTSPLWMTFVGACILGPLGEELLFRKLLIDRTRRYGDLPSILLSGILFGLFHSNLFQLFYATAIGMVLAYVYTRTGKYWWCVAMHAAMNLVGTVVTPALMSVLPADLISFENRFQPLIYLFLVAWQYGMLIAGIVLFSIQLSRRKLSRGPDPLRHRQAASIMLGNPGMVASLLVMGLTILLNLLPNR